jgi:hypothetical protein
LYEVLRSCPSIALSSVVKESYFFHRNFDRGVEWYESLFGDLEGKEIIGEIDSNLLNHGYSATNIKKINPEAKLIAIFRDPATLYLSSYLFDVKDGKTTDTPEEVWERQPHFRREVSFYSRIKPFLDRFPRDQLLFLTHEEVRADGEASLDRIFAFLGVAASYDPNLLAKEVNVSRVSRAPWLTNRIFRAVHFLRARRFHRLVAAGKRMGLNNLLEAMMKPQPSTGISPQLRARIFEDLRDELEAFEREVGIAWTP